VEDYDASGENDFMGMVEFQPNQIELKKPMSGPFELLDKEGQSCVVPDGEIIVSIIQARGLPIMDASFFGGGDADPFIELHHGGEVRKSSTIKGTLEPQYDEMFLLPYNKGENSIDLKVYDYDLLGSNDFMCSTQISLSDADSMTPCARENWGGVPRQWYSLKDENGDSAGEIELELAWSSSALGSLSMKVEWVEKLESTVVGRLIVEVIQARGLLACDSSIFSREGTSDPQVRVKHGHTSRQTCTMWSNLNPVWENEKFKFSFDTAFPLEIVVEDFDLAGNDFMGQLQLPIKDLLTKGVALRQWFKLEPEDGDDKNDYGELELRLKWKDNYQEAIKGML
jgi:Ca2+-dependent lipid-binding protein